jgi:hypothetical protein
MSFLIFRRLAGGGLGFVVSCTSSTTSSSCTASGVSGTLSFTRLTLCPPGGTSSGFLRFVALGVMDQSQGRRGSENGKREFKLRSHLFPSPRHHPQAQPRAVRDLHATAADSTLSYRHHEPAARYRRTKHSDVEGQETDQKPRCCQRVPSAVDVLSRQRFSDTCVSTEPEHP